MPESKKEFRGKQEPGMRGQGTGRRKQGRNRTLSGRTYREERKRRRSDLQAKSEGSEFFTQEIFAVDGNGVQVVLCEN